MFDILATYTGNAEDLKPWIQGAQINTDEDLRLSYLAGWGINANLEDELYRQMLSYRHPPIGMFTGAPEHVQLLLGVLGAR